MMRCCAERDSLACKGIGLILMVLMSCHVSGLWAQSAETGPDRSSQSAPADSDRSTPRAMLATFLFNVNASAVKPALMGRALVCMDLGDLSAANDPEEAAMIALKLAVILDGLNVDLTLIPDDPKLKRFRLGGAHYPIELVPQSDGQWVFSNLTVQHSSRMAARLAADLLEQEWRDRNRGRMVVGHESAHAAMVGYLDAVKMMRFDHAADYLDMDHLSDDVRRRRGPILSQKLAYAMQRIRFIFLEELSNNRVAPPHTWYVGPMGRIELSRTIDEKGRSTWRFSRRTVERIDAIYNAVKTRPIRRRYEIIGWRVPDPAAGVATRLSRRPEHVPEALGSPRAALRTFFRAMSDALVDDAKLSEVYHCMDMSAVDRRVAGKLATQLNEIVDKLNIDPDSLSNRWDAEPVNLAADRADYIVRLERQADGAWRFAPDTVGHIPEMYAALRRKLDAEGEAVKTARSSPQQTMLEFLNEMNDEDPQTAARCLDLRHLPPGARDEVGWILAEKLRYVMGHLTRVYLQEVPGAEHGPPYVWFRNEVGQIVIAKVADGSRQGQWLFDKRTVRSIPKLFDWVVQRQREVAGSQQDWFAGAPSWWYATGLWLKYRMPGSLKYRLLGMELYQWVFTPVLVGLLLTLAWLLAWLISRGIYWGARFRGVELTLIEARYAIRPSRWLIFLVLVQMFISVADLPVLVMSWTLPVVKFALSMVMVWAAYRVIDLFQAYFERSGVDTPMKRFAIHAIARLLKFIVLIIALAWLVYIIGKGDSLTKLLAGLGIGGLAFALAAQDTLRNFFGSVFLVGDRPFRIGDWIKVGSTEGVVESLGFRSTRIRTFADSVVALPNSVVASESIENFGQRQYRRYLSHLRLAYGTPLDRVMALRDRILQWVIDEPRLRKDKYEVRVHRLGVDAIELMIYVYFKVPDWSAELAAREDLNLKMLALADELGVEITPPTQSVQLRRDGAAGRSGA